MSQKEIVLQHLMKHGSIDTWQAIKTYNITRLSAIIFLLKADGHKIVTKPFFRDNKKWVLYTFHPKVETPADNKKGQGTLFGSPAPWEVER
jgi:hypothetical protein